MLTVRLQCRADLTDAVLDALRDDPDVSGLAVLRGVSELPPGDVVFADVTREGANAVVDRLLALGVTQEGTLQLGAVSTWVSQPAFQAEIRSPGSSADAVVWAEVVQTAYRDSELNWTYLSFMTLATLLAAIAIVVDSQVLVIGAMVLGPEFGAIAATGVALVRRRFGLLRLAIRTLLLGFVAAIAVTTLLSLVARAAGWVTLDDVTGPRPGTAFIYTPDRWSFVVAVIAAAAGVLSLTSSRLGGLSGVFISVTTVPAAGNLALGIAFGVSSAIAGSALQLLLNISGMVVAGWLTLVLQRAVWSRMQIRHSRPGSGAGRR